MAPARFSVIIPTLNEEKYLPNLLRSLTRQTVKNFEVIVVDGSSKDNTVDVAKRFRSIDLTVLTSLTGVSKQRNMGAAHAKAHWLVFVDADSVLLPNFFERIGVFIDRTHPKFFTTWLKTDSDDPAEAITGFFINMSIEGGILIERPWAPGPLTVVRKDVFESVGGYDEQTTFGEDHDLSMVIRERGILFEVFREILYIYSLRRFRKEGNLKVFERNVKSALKVILTKRGPKHMPGFIGGGSLYAKDSHKRTRPPVLSKKLQESARKFIQEFIAE